MANPYIHPGSYYDQSGPVSYTYNNDAGPSTYPYQYGVNGHAYQNYHPQQQQQHYMQLQNPILDGKQPPYPYHQQHYSASPPPSSWHQQHQQHPEIHSPVPKQLSTPHFPEHPETIDSNPPSSPPPTSNAQEQQPPLSPTDSHHSTNSPFSPTWAVWSRRPSNPNLAPGLVFSSRIRPPDHIVREALDVRTPPASPLVETANLPVPADSEIPTEPELAKEETQVVESVFVPLSASSEETSTTATETPSTTLPGSPASSATSISVSASAAKPLELIHESNDAVSDDVAIAPADAGTTPSPSNTASSSPETIPVPTVQPQPVPPPLKKSWASLLRPATAVTAAGSSQTLTTATLASTRPKIPVSTVVGFSIPAKIAEVPQGSTIPPGKRAELLALLNSGLDVSSSPSSGTSTSYAAASKVKVEDKDSSVSISPAQIHPRGLINTGNMCFANSVLQLLVYSPPFFKLFYQLGRIGTKEVRMSTQTPLIDATMAFLDEFLPEEKERKANADASTAPVSNGVASGSGSNTVKGKGKERSSTPLSSPEDELTPFIPTPIYDALKTKKQFDSMMPASHQQQQQQQDAEEFLGFYLDGLEEELGEIRELLLMRSSDAVKRKVKEEVEETEEDAPPEAEEDGWLEVGKRNRTVVTRTIKSADSPITRIFGGKYRSSLRMPGQKESAIVEDWRSLRLDIQKDTIHTIQDALSAISQPQTIHLTDPAREGSQQVLIEGLPPVLVIHLKRFEYDAQVGGVVKVGKQVTFGPELVVGGDLLTPKAKAGGRKEGVKYKLFGAIYHHGISASGGHYTLDVLHPDRYHTSRSGAAKSQPIPVPREGWIRIDDELVSDVRPEDVFGQGDFEDNGMRCPYLLFYRRV